MDQAAAERKLQEAVGFTYYPVGSNENWRDAAVFRLWNHAVSLQSQLSASEERVRKQLEIIHYRAQGELEDAETLVQARAGLQAIASYVESLLPSPPQVEERK